jgi:hypothetical protein
MELTHKGVRYRVEENGDVFTWIERRQKASGWQKIKSAPRIKKITKLATTPDAVETAITAVVKEHVYH